MQNSNQCISVRQCSTDAKGNLTAWLMVVPDAPIWERTWAGKVAMGRQTESVTRPTTIAGVPGACRA